MANLTVFALLIGAGAAIVAQNLLMAKISGTTTTILVPLIMSSAVGRVITRSIRHENAMRQELAASILEGHNYIADPHGHHLWLRLPQHWRAADFAEHADRAGVSIMPASAFATVAHPIKAVRISLWVAPDRGDLEDGLNQLASLITHSSLGARAVV